MNARPGPSLKTLKLTLTRVQTRDSAHHETTRFATGGLIRHRWWVSAREFY